MEVRISDHSMRLENGGEVYVCSNGSDDGDVRISFVVGGCSLICDLSVDELQYFGRIINEAVEEAFRVQPELRCPACGYTQRDVDLHGDHRSCRRYPLFPGESGKSHAVSR